MKRKFDATIGPKDTLEHYFISAEQRAEKRMAKFKRLKIDRDAHVEKEGSILIAHRTDGRNRANGALFDHCALQGITNTRTMIAWDKTDKKKSVNWLKDYISTLPYELKFGIEVAGTTSGVPHALFVPGVAAENYNNQNAYYSRVKYEFSLFKQAFRQGKPILAVCGGAWELWRFCHLISQDISQKMRLIPNAEKLLKEENQCTDQSIKFFSDPNEYTQAYDDAREQAEENLLQNRTHFLQTVSEHGYRRMPGLSATDGGATHNIQMHRIKLQADAFWLMAAMQLKDTCHQPTVNSVHWQACDARQVPAYVTVSACAVRDHEIAPHRSKEEGTKWQPEENSIEAFELNYGAPVLGMQWHPEAYFEKNENKKTTEEQHNCEQQRHILQYINRAGHTYQVKRLFVKEINSIGKNISNWRQQHLKPTGLLKKQKARLYFFDHQFKDGALFYQAQMVIERNLPVTHTREAKQAAIKMELLKLQAVIGKNIHFSEATISMSLKKRHMKSSTDFFPTVKIEKKPANSIYSYFVNVKNSSMF